MSGSIIDTLSLDDASRAMLTSVRSVRQRGTRVVWLESKAGTLRLNMGGAAHAVEVVLATNRARVEAGPFPSRHEAEVATGRHIRDFLMNPREWGVQRLDRSA